MRDHSYLASELRILN